MILTRRTLRCSIHPGPHRDDLRGDHSQLFSFGTECTFQTTQSAEANESTGPHEELMKSWNHTAILESSNSNISVDVLRQSSSMIRVRRILRCSIHPGPHRDDLRGDHFQLFSFGADRTFQTTQPTEANESTGPHEEMTKPQGNVRSQKPRILTPLLMSFTKVPL
jgi:hypothetical protein